MTGLTRPKGGAQDEVFRRIYQAITGGIEEGVTEFDVQLTESGENLQVMYHLLLALVLF